MRDVPVVVSHSAKAGTGVVSSCNYIARARGVRNGMGMKAAVEACPELTVIPYEFDTYMQLSAKFHTVINSGRWGTAVQTPSCDEAFIVLTDKVQEIYNISEVAEMGGELGNGDKDGGRESESDSDGNNDGQGDEVEQRGKRPNVAAHVAALRVAVMQATGLVVRHLYSSVVCVELIPFVDIMVCFVAVGVCTSKGTLNHTPSDLLECGSRVGAIRADASAHLSWLATYIPQPIMLPTPLMAPHH